MWFRSKFLAFPMKTVWLLGERSYSEILRKKYRFDAVIKYCLFIVYFKFTMSCNEYAIITK